MKPLALVIEDDPNLSQIFSLTLKEDFETETYTDGNAALERLSQIVPRLLILDLNLPGIPGNEILAHIRADERLKGVTVMLATADHRQADTLQDQADFVLLKPVSPIQLRQIAARVK